jgi:hypothetical protein
MTAYEYLVDFRACLDRCFINATDEANRTAIYKKIQEVNERIFSLPM